MLKRPSTERQKVDRALKTRGLGGLSDPKLVSQLAFLVRNHEHFRKILIVLHPKERYQCYEALRPHLRFQAKPLADYISEAADLAARELQRSAYETQSAMDLLAQDAIRKAQAIENKQGLIKFKCRTCERTDSFAGKLPEDSAAAAERDGWRVIAPPPPSPSHILCPQCSIASRA